MESVAHCRRKPNKPSVALSNNNGSFSGKSLYDDVYGGPPKFGVSSLSPRFEDYSEIFGSFHTARATSIPVLDLPAVHESEAFFDPRSNSFNYNEVFGALDFVASYSNLFHQSTGLDEEAWTSAETDSFSGESSHSGNNESMSNGDLFQSVDGNTAFNVSYHKVSGRSNEHMSKGKTHMTQLHAVPGFSQVCDETTHSHRIDPSNQVADDIDLDTELSADKVIGNNLRKTMPHLHTSGEQTFGSDLKFQDRCGRARNDSHSSEMFITVSDISLRSTPSQVPPPARQPPVLDAKKGDTYGFHSNGGLVASEETPGDSSPPFFDVEVDMNSSGAASADALKEALLRAEAKLRSTTKLKERKKWVYESRVKSSHDLENNEAKMNKDVSRLNSLNDETMQESYDRRHSKMKVSATDERQKLRKASSETLKDLEGKRISHMFEERHMKEYRPSQDSDKRTGAGTWKEESEFFELKGTGESGMVIQPTKLTNILEQDTRNQERGQKERETSNMQEKYKRLNAIGENNQGEEYGKKSKAAKEAYEQDNNIMRSEASGEKWRQREHVKKEKVAKMFELEENEKNVRMVHQDEKTEKNVTEADQSGSLEDVSEMGHKEHKKLDTQKSKEVDRQTLREGQLGMRLKENERKPTEVEKQKQSVKKHKQFMEMKENGKSQGEAFTLGQAEYEEKPKDFVEPEDIDERSKDRREEDACRIENEMRLKQILNKKGLEEAHERVEIEKDLKGSLKKEQSDEALKHPFGRDENGKRFKEDFELDINQIRLKEAFKQRENKAYERDQNRKNFEKVCNGEGNIPEEASENKGIQKVLNQAPEKEWKNGMLNEAHRKKEIESTSNQTLAREGSIALSNENSHLQYENMDNNVGRIEKNMGLDKALDDMEGNKEERNTKFAKATDETRKAEINENLFAAQSASVHEENIVKLEVSPESVAEQEIGETRTECKVGEKKLEDIGVENQLADEKVRAPEVTPGDDTKHSGTESGKVDDTVTKVDYRGSTEAAEPAREQESVNVHKYAQRFHVGQSTERKEKSLNETPATVVNDADRMRRERESEKDRLRKVEEERDREREREKDRVAVDNAMLEAERERERIKDRMAMDRATVEAHDKAYAEACEKAERAAFERATMETQQRALAEAKERLEKACAEARVQSNIDRAERAAVERATAEAQECAIDKLKAERAEFESREQLERSVSDKIGVCSRNRGTQDSLTSDMLDPQFENVSSTSSRYPYSLYGAASFSVRSEREGESARRCRARLERHRRTAERAAKALAEKNMRDLLAQKEQAERNRLAETLDAEVRRWSSGKEGNLRALLSTLQYILGQHSGWQPIPLTEVITSAAVKKAYRKATLCVHPDKLQQRGASIQHKYICEKVFDLLKDAWNKFNSEER